MKISPSDGDSPVLPELPDQFPEDEDTCTVTADGTHGTRRCPIAIMPIRKNGRPWKEHRRAAIAEIETLRAIRHDGSVFRTRRTGNHARSRIVARMRCLKAFGECIRAREPDRKPADTGYALLS